jgi:hypothetical protein
MSARSSILALAAVATVATAAFGTTSASANVPMGVVVKKPILGVVIKPQPVLGVVIKPPHPILGVVINPPHPIMGVVIHHPDHDDDDDHDHHFWWHRDHRPWLVEDGTPRVSTAVTTAPTAPTAPCTCLTKNYLTDGSVMFKDVCTKEAAVASPAELKAQMQGSTP